MLLRHDVLLGIESGRIGFVYRRWARPRVLPGSTMRTQVGVLEVTAVDVVDPDDLTPEDAAAAGCGSVEELLRVAGSRGETLYRIGVRFVGPDPRIALRSSIPDESEVTAVLRRLDRFDSSSREGPWARETLRLIADNPGARAEDIAASVGREKRPFKNDVRKLKELGLTESLAIGYRLSPRGERILHELPD